MFLFCLNDFPLFLFSHLHCLPITSPYTDSKVGPRQSVQRRESLQSPYDGPLTTGRAQLGSDAQYNRLHRDVLLEHFRKWYSENS